MTRFSCGWIVCSKKQMGGSNKDFNIGCWRCLRNERCAWGMQDVHARCLKDARPRVCKRGREGGCCCDQAVTLVFQEFRCGNGTATGYIFAALMSWIANSWKSGCMNGMRHWNQNQLTIRSSCPQRIGQVGCWTCPLHWLWKGCGASCCATASWNMRLQADAWRGSRNRGARPWAKEMATAEVWIRN